VKMTSRVRRLRVSNIQIDFHLWDLAIQGHYYGNFGENSEEPDGLFGRHL
jgi:hypothetical protein